MGVTKAKGDTAEVMIMAEAIKRGYKVALPLGEDWRYDLIVLREGNLERVQCKYVESDERVIKAKCESTNNWQIIKYTETDFEWLAVYDKTTDQCYFLPSDLLGQGRRSINLRLKPSKNGQKKGVRWAKDFLQF